DSDPDLDHGRIASAQQDRLAARKPRRVGRADSERGEGLQAGLDSEKKRRPRDFRGYGGLAVGHEVIDADRIDLAKRADHRSPQRRHVPGAAEQAAEIARESTHIAALAAFGL